MYRKQMPTNTSIPNNVKKPNRNCQPLPLPDKKNQSQTDFKSKDEQLLQLIKEHLLNAGYLRTHDVLKNQRPNLRARAQINQGGKNPDFDKNSVMGYFDRGNRQEFFKHTNKYWSIDDAARALQFDLCVYFCIYNVHPNCRRQTSLDNGSAVAFKKYLQTRASQIPLDKDQLILFSIPHMPKPQQNPAFAHLFCKDFVIKLRLRLSQFLTSHARLQGPVGAQTSRKASGLQQIYYLHLTSSNSSREQSKQNCNHVVELEALRQQNSQLRGIIENYHRKFDEFAESSKQNLYESNQKWFHFSCQIFNLARKYIREDKVKALQKYGSFFVGNFEEMMQANQISLFDKNSLLQDASVNPDASKQRIVRKLEQPSSCQLDLPKIRHLFLQANIKQKQIEVLTVLRALKQRFNRSPGSLKRREIVIEYSRGDLCGIKEENYVVQKRLFFDGGERIREYYIKLIEAITTDVTGLQYLNKSKHLIQNLVGVFGSERQENRCFKSVVGILQRLSFSRQPRLQMISLGIIPMIFRVFRNEGSDISVFTLQFLTAMMMNLSLKKESKPDFQAHKAQLVSIIIQHMASENTQVRDYINGSIYLLLHSKAIREEAFRQKLDTIVKGHLENREEDMCSQQYAYILKRLSGEEEGDFGGEDSEEEQEEAEMEQADDFEEDDVGSVSSDDPLDGDLDIAQGEEILMKNYALLGPDAVREHILTRSVLDETSKRLNNMTTSINRSRRLDNIFQKNNATVLEPQLSALLNRKR